MRSGAWSSDAQVLARGAPGICPTCGARISPTKTYCDQRCRIGYVKRHSGGLALPGAMRQNAAARAAGIAALAEVETPPCVRCSTGRQLPGLVETTSPLKGLCGACAARAGVGT